MIANDEVRLLRIYVKDSQVLLVDQVLEFSLLSKAVYVLRFLFVATVTVAAPISTSRLTQGAETASLSTEAIDPPTGAAGPV